MKGWIVLIGIIIWILLLIVVLAIGTHILESLRKSEKKNWGREARDYDHEKWMFRFYVIAFFVGIPLLFVIAIIQEFS